MGERGLSAFDLNNGKFCDMVGDDHVIELLNAVEEKAVGIQDIKQTLRLKCC